MADCLFCNFGNGTLSIPTLHEDDLCLAFADIHPQAPTHILILPRQHFPDVTHTPAPLLGHLLHTAAEIAARTLPGGHRIVINTGENGGQTVPHLHLHLLGGRPLSWPPG